VGEQGTGRVGPLGIDDDLDTRQLVPGLGQEAGDGWIDVLRDADAVVA
jgi:hypothetical protein